MTNIELGTYTHNVNSTTVKHLCIKAICVLTETTLAGLYYTGSHVHQLLQCVPWVVLIYRFHCTSTTTVCPLDGLYIQVPLYINYYNVSLGWSLYTSSTVHQLLQCVPWVVFIYRFHCTSTTTVCPLGGLFIQVPLYINYYNVSLGWSLYTGSIPLYINYYIVSLGRSSTQVSTTILKVNCPVFDSRHFCY